MLLCTETLMMDILPTSSSIDADAQDVDEQATYIKSEELRRVKGKSKVWDKMTKFARRSRRYSVPLPEGACVPDDDAAAMPQSADGMDYDPNPFHLSGSSSAWFEGSSSSDGEITETLRMKKSRLYPNNETVEQSSSVVRAPFQQEAGSIGRGGRPTKYGWQKKKRRAHHSFRCADHVTGLMSDNARSTSNTVDFTGSKNLGNPIPHQRHTSSVSLDSSFARHSRATDKQFLTLPRHSPADDYDMCVAMKTASLPNYHSHSFQKTCKKCGLMLNTTHSPDNGVVVDGMSDMFAACFCQCTQQKMYKANTYGENQRGCCSGVARSSYVAPVEFKTKLEVRSTC